MSRTRGRPAATDQDQIALAAFRLFRERGFEAVSMDDIAGELGIGRSTLFRYFSSKAAILWIHHDQTSAEFVEGLAEAPAGAPLADAVFAAYERVLRLHSHQIPLAKGMIGVIVTEAPDATGKWGAYARWARYVAEFVAARRGGSPDDQDNETLGTILWASLWTALEHWAVSDDLTPAHQLAAAHAGLRTLSTAVTGPSGAAHASSARPTRHSA